MVNDRAPMFIVPRLFRSVSLDVSGREVKINASWSDDMIGVVPVFATYEAAKKYDPEAEPVEVREVPA